MTWAIFAFLAGITYCVQIEVNRHYKFDGSELNTYRAFMSSLLLLPFVGFMELPHDWRYYLVVLLCSSINVVCMMVQYNLAASKNGRVANLHQPITIFITFCAWLVLDSEQLKFLRDDPTRLGGILISFLLLFISIQFVRKNDAGWRALMTIFPVAVLYSFWGVISKLVLDHGDDPLPTALGFVMVSNIMMGVISLPMILYSSKKDHKIFRPEIVKPAGAVAVFHTISWIFFCISTILAPNAAYPFVILSLSPLWFLLYYKARGIKDDASPLAGAIMFLSAVILILATKA